MKMLKKYFEKHWMRENFLICSKLFLDTLKCKKKMKVLDNYIFLVLWERGAGKTMFSTIFAYLEKYHVVLANYTIQWLNKEFVKYENKDIFSKLEPQPIDRKGLIILDEWGINLNSRRSQETFNVMMGKLLFVSRKYNYDFIFITQYLFTVDKYIRESANFFLQLKKEKYREKFLLNVDVYKNSKFSNSVVYMKSFKINPRPILQKVWYNTLETSVLK